MFDGVLRVGASPPVPAVHRLSRNPFVPPIKVTAINMDPAKSLDGE